jgi:predicted metalloenzyme YecM
MVRTDIPLSQWSKYNGPDTLEEFLKDASICIKVFDAFAQSRKIAGLAYADHICYKCDSKRVFESVRAMFEEHSIFIYQSIISERRIAYIKLRGSLPSILGPIRYVELSDQKPDGSQKNGIDHVEVCPAQKITPGGASYTMLVQRLQETSMVREVVRPHHTTHDIDIGDDFIFRCAGEPLIDKIKREEFV